MTWQERRYQQEPIAMSPFISATAILDFWRMSSRRQTIGLPELAPLNISLRKHGDSRWNFVVRPMSLCSRSRDMHGVNIFYSSAASKRRKKTVVETRVIQYANFHTVCSQNNAYVVIFCPKILQFSPAAIEVWKVFPGRETLGPLDWKGEGGEREGIKGFLPLKDGEGMKQGGVGW